MTLAEIMVAVFLLAIVGTIISGIIISSLKLTRSTTSGIEGEGELNDAVSRITRDIATADPILWTSESNGWRNPDGSPINSPSADELWTQSDTDGKCVRTRYVVEDAGDATQLVSYTQSYPATEGCPDPRLPDDRDDSRKVIVKDLKTTDDSGAEVDLFTYYAKNNSELIPAVSTGALSQSQVDQIARVKINIGSNVRDRDLGVRLVTSVAPRSMDNPIITAVPRPVCAGLSVTRSAGDPNYPVVTWPTNIEYADRYTLIRTVEPRRAGLPTPPAWPVNGVDVTGNNGTYADTQMRGWWDYDITYSLELDGPGGPSAVPCFAFLPGLAAAPNPGAPDITVRLTPDTSSVPSAISPNPVTIINWTCVPRATHYQVWRRTINPNTYRGTGTWTEVGSPTTSCSTTVSEVYDDGHEYKVTAVSNDYTPALFSADSNPASVVTHTNNITLSGTPVTYQVNRLNWTRATDSTVDGYALFRRPAGTSNWGSPIWQTTNTNTLTYTDNSAALGSTYEYILTSYNNGPRGTIQTDPNTRYYGQPSNTARVLQYPDIPRVTATGTENNHAYNEDGRNTASWLPVTSATRYDLWEMDSIAGAATATVNVGNNTLHRDYGNSRGTRNFYMAVAWNATGPSENYTNPALRPGVTDDAFQRPANINTTVGHTTNDSCPDVAAAANNRVFHCDTRQANASFTPNADAGEPSDKFCSLPGNPAGCRYLPVVNGSQQTGAAVYGAPAGTPTTTVTQSAWGATDEVGVVACNAGGCSDPNPVDVRAYPGPFNIKNGPTDSTEEENHTQWWEGNNMNDWPRTDAKANVVWSDSAGARPRSTYWVERTVRAHDPDNAVFDFWRDYPETDWRVSTPGAAYNYDITAFATNGLERKIRFTMQIRPAKVGFIQSTHFCNSARRQVGTKKVTERVQVCEQVRVKKTRTVQVFDRWVDCNNTHAKTNPNPGTCENRPHGNHGKHWERKTYKNVTETYWDWERQCRWVDKVTEEPIMENVNEWGWKAGYKFRTGGYDNAGGRSYSDQWHWVEYINRLGNPDRNYSDSYGNFWMQNARAAWGTTPPARGFPDKPKTWERYQEQYWEWGTTGTSHSMTGERNTASTWGDTEELISNLDGSGGANRVKAEIFRSGAHNTDAGNHMGFDKGDTEYKGEDLMHTCGTGWNPLPGWISRTAHKLSPGYGRPGGSMSDWYQNG